MRREDLDAGPDERYDADDRRDEQPDPTPEEVERARAAAALRQYEAEAEKGHRRAEWHHALQAAHRDLAQRREADAAVKLAAARETIEGETFRDGAALFGFLYQARKHELGRALGLSEMREVRWLVSVLWPEMSAFAAITAQAVGR